MNNITKRTIVLGDIHGQMRLLNNALSHANYNSEKDSLVIAGDWVDIGKESRQMWEELKKMDAILLIGNHELSHLVGQYIQPYDSSLDYTNMFKEMAQMIINKEIGLAHAVGDVLITHAGVSEMLSKSTRVPILYNVPHTAEDISRVLNEYWYSVCSMATDGSNRLFLLEGSEWLYNSQLSPLWYRANRHTLPLDIKQVVGHTPVESHCDFTLMNANKRNFTLIDPYNSAKFNLLGYSAYGLITEFDDGTITVKRVETL